MIALDFLRRYKQWMIPMTFMKIGTKAQYFGSCLLPLSPAEAWFDALSDQDRNNSETVLRLFAERFAKASQSPPCKPGNISQTSLVAEQLTTAKSTINATTVRIIVSPIEPISQSASDGQPASSKETVPIVATQTERAFKSILAEMKENGSLTAYLKFRNHILQNFEHLPVGDQYKIDHVTWARKMLNQARSLAAVPDKLKRSIFKKNAGRTIAKMTVLAVGDNNFESMAQYVSHLSTPL